jgi:hypothetical protein
MRDVLSADRAAGPEAPARARALHLPAGARVGMVLLGFIPALHLIATLTPVTLAATGRLRGGAAFWLALATLFLLPPLVVRASTWWRPFESGKLEPGGRGFMHWWFAAQWQVIFTRLPMLEEMIRIVPGLYSLWLRLWGARVGALVYWSPGVVILDRPLVRIGKRVVFGVGARLTPHVIAPDGPRRMVLYLSPITIGDDALVGGYSMLLPGCEVAGGEVTPPFRTIHAFSRYANGRRMRGADDMEDAG